MASLELDKIRRYLADSDSPRPSQLEYGGTWLDIKWDLWDDTHYSRGFRFRTGHAYYVWDVGTESGRDTLCVVEVVNSKDSRLLDLQVEIIHSESW